MKQTARTIGLSAVVALVTGIAIPGAPSARTADEVACRGCVDRQDIDKNAVTSGKVRNGTIRPIDLANSAKPAGVAYTETDRDVILQPTGTDLVLLSVFVDAPGPGAIVATGSLHVDFNNQIGVVACDLSRTSVLMNYHYTRAKGDAYAPISTTRAFDVDEADTVQINLICQELSGNVESHNPMLTAIFVPQLCERPE